MKGQRSRARLVATAATVVALIGAVAGTAVALGEVATTSRAPKLTIRCPKRVASGRTVTCRVLRGLWRGPRGRRGPRGPEGPRGKTGARGQRGPTGPAGVSGYEVVNKAFPAVAVPKSGTARGLSAVQTVACPSGKRVVGGGYDLGTNPAQAAAQRQVSVSLSAPTGTATGWSVQLFNASATEDTAIDLLVYAVCARTG